MAQGRLTRVKGSVGNIGFEALRKVYSLSDYTLVVGSFESGAVLQKENDVILYEKDGLVYKWSGDYPRFVSSGEEPTGTFWEVITGDKLSDLESRVSKEIPPFEYSEGVHYSPINKDGVTLSSMSFVKPTDVDFKYTSELKYKGDEPFVSFGVKGLNSGSGFSQDLYSLRNLTISDVAGSILSVEPWCGLMTDIDNNKITNSGKNGDYLFELKLQNWWPSVTNNIVSDNSGVGFKFLKAIDDGGSSGRFSGNSRCVISNNRLKWQGGVGGQGFYTSAVCTMYNMNAIEGCGVGIQLGYPSFSTKVKDTYCELPRKNSTFMVIGDDGAVSGTNSIAGVVIDGAYINAHNFESNEIITTKPNTIVSRITLDNIFLSGLFVNKPILNLNDIAGNSVICGNIISSGSPLLNMTKDNPVHVIDKYSLTKHQLNSDFVGLDTIEEQDVIANSSTPIQSSNVFVRSASASKLAIRDVDSSNKTLLRMSDKYLELKGSPASSKSVYWFVDVSKLVTHCSFQVFCKTDVPSTVTLLLIKKSTSSVVSQKTFNVSGNWSELSMSSYINPKDSNVKPNDYFIQVNTTSGSLYVTGLRSYSGGTALCVTPCNFNKVETKRLVAQTSYAAP